MLGGNSQYKSGVSQRPLSPVGRDPVSPKLLYSCLWFNEKGIKSVTMQCVSIFNTYLPYCGNSTLKKKTNEEHVLVTLVFTKKKIRIKIHPKTQKSQRDTVTRAKQPLSDTYRRCKDVPKLSHSVGIVPVRSLLWFVFLWFDSIKSASSQLREGCKHIEYQLNK